MVRLWLARWQVAPLNSSVVSWRSHVFVFSSCGLVDPLKLIPNLRSVFHCVSSSVLLLPHTWPETRQTKAKTRHMTAKHAPLSVCTPFLTNAYPNTCVPVSCYFLLSSSKAVSPHFCFFFLFALVLVCEVLPCEQTHAMSCALILHTHTHTFEILNTILYLLVSFMLVYLSFCQQGAGVHIQFQACKCTFTSYEAKNLRGPVCALSRMFDMLNAWSSFVKESHGCC